MSQLFVAVFVALLSCVDGFASASVFPGGTTFVSTSGSSHYPKYHYVNKYEEKPKPTLVIVKDEPAHKPMITIVADKVEEEAPVVAPVQLTFSEDDKEEEKEEEVVAVVEVEAAKVAEPVEEEASKPKKNRKKDNKKNKCNTIVDVASGVPELSNLVAAVTAAGLADVLADPELIATVLAPTNEAFEAVAAEFGATLEEVLADSQLVNILLYHVIGGTASTAEMLEDGAALTTLVPPGQELTVQKSRRGGVTFVGPTTSANVVTADVEACSAIVHVIDAVLLPNFAEIPAPVAAPAIE